MTVLLSNKSNIRHNVTYTYSFFHFLDKLDFWTVSDDFVCPSNSTSHIYFCTDEDLVYTSFFADFGPLDLGLTCTFCQQLNDLLASAKPAKKRVIYYCSNNPHNRANSAVLLCAYLVSYLNFEIVSPLILCR